jgi:uncharacterized coiled-coil protein SlyX
MPNRILKELAVAAGTTLAMGRAKLNSDADLLDLEPLLDRLERLEAQAESGNMQNRVASDLEQLSARVGAIELTLTEQAGAIQTLNVRTSETDANLQRLVVALEKLCDRVQLLAPEPEQTREPETRLPFESQLHDAMDREPVVPVLRTQEPDAEVDLLAKALAAAKKPAPKKSRFLFR